jgi:hypothetical protein
MNEKVATVKFLLIYKQTALVTRPEVGLMIGKSVGSIAATCRDNDISGWPDVSAEVKQLRTCCFLVTPLDAVNPRLCSKPKASPDEFRCEEHVGAVYQLVPPPAKDM